MISRIRVEAGVGLVEVLIAMTVLTIGIMALVAGFSSGHSALDRASSASTAAVLADAKMESYRAGRYTSVPTCMPVTRAATDVCTETVPKTGPDGRTYQLQLTYEFACATGTLSSASTVTAPVCTPPPPTPPLPPTPPSKPTKLVRILVTNQDGTKTLFRQTSTFHSATG